MHAILCITHSYIEYIFGKEEKIFECYTELQTFGADILNSSDFFL